MDGYGLILFAKSSYLENLEKPTKTKKDFIMKIGLVGIIINKKNISL